MKRRFLAGIALLLTLAMLSGSGLSALADAPEALDEIFEEIEAVQDGEGEAANEVELIPEDEDVLMLEGDDPLIDDLTGDDLALDGLADLELSDPEILDSGLSEELLVGDTEGATEEAAMGLATDETGSNNVETSAEGTVEAVTTSGGMDNDALFEAWIRQRLPGLAPRRTYASALSGRASLDGINLKLYDLLVPMIKAVAEGEETSTQFKIETADVDIAEKFYTAEELGLTDLSDSDEVGEKLKNTYGIVTKSVMNALLTDYPYELYWFDKVTGGMGISPSMLYRVSNGVRIDVKLSYLTTYMGVAKAYSKEGEIGTFEVNPVLPERVTAAVENIKTIIANNKDNGDLAKLRAYANTICRLVKYNTDAADKTNNTPYGDPWQLVYIFDGDDTDDTNVVCEGYSKGFKYLCDLSEFDGEVYCELMSGSISAGAHMWNALRMPDGRTYLVDLTNSDGGSTCNERYFLKGFSGEPGGPFTSNATGQKFTLNDNMAALFPIAWRTMSGADYGKGYTVEASAEHGTLTAEPAIADAGQTVTLTVAPDEGYVVAMPTVKLGKQSLSLQQAGTNKWSFTMPYGDVTAVATCEQGGGFTVEEYDGEYDGQPHGIRVTTEAEVRYGVEQGDCNMSESPEWTDVGTYRVYFTIDGDSEVHEATVKINPRTAALSWSDAELTYNGSEQAPVATVDNLVAGDSCAVTVTGAQRNAGSYTATASGLSNGNYALPQANTHAYTIGRKRVTVSGIIAEDKVYDGGTAATLDCDGAGFDGLVDGDSLTVTATGAFADKAAGEVKGVFISSLALGGSDAANYALAASGNQDVTYASINPRSVTVTGIVAADKVYDGGTAATLDCDSALFGGIVTGDSLTVTAAGVFADKTAGEGKTVTISSLTLGGADAANYALADSGNQAEATASITRRPVTVTGLSVADKVYDGTTDATVSGEATISGRLDGDDVDVLASGVTFEDKNVGVGKTVTFADCQLIGADAGNYRLAEQVSDATANITAKEIGLEWGEDAFTYDGDVHMPAATATGLLEGDACTITVTGGQKNAGSYTATASALSNGNYALPEANTHGYTVDARVVTVGGIVAEDKEYDGDTAAALDFSKLTFDGIVDGDSLTVAVTGAFADKNVGEDKAVSLTGLALGGSDAANYMLAESGNQADATASITPRPVTIAGLSVEDREYDGTYAANVTGVATIVGKMDDDTVEVVAGSAAFADKNAGKGKAVIFTGYSLTGADSGNYSLTAQPTAEATITPVPVGLDWSSTAFTYDGSTHIPTATATGLLEGDACAVTVTGGQKDAGSYTATATGLSNGNYALPATATQAYIINKRTAALSWSNTGLTYNGAEQAPVATVSNLLSGDACTVKVTGGQKDAGSYSATATGLSNKNYALPATATQAYTIAPKTATLTWSNTALTYNAKIQKPTVTVSNLVSGDACAVTVTGGKKDAGSYTATATGLSNKNYTLPATATKAFAIKPKTVTLKWSNTSLTYNGKLQKPKVTVTGLVSGDKCTATLTGSRKNAGTYTARVTKLSNKNYALPKVRTKTCTIKKKTVKLKWTKTKLKYNGKSLKPTATATGLIKGDKCTVTVSGAKVKKGTYTAKAIKLSNQNYQLPTKATVKFKIY